MTLEHGLALLGMGIAFIGACLLFFYGLPKKTIGNVIIYGSTAIKVESSKTDRDIPPEEWQPIADSFQKRAKFLNSTGFALVAFGTLLQMASICVTI